MLIYYISYILMSSLIGIILMEAGQYGPDIGMAGYPNGASLHYVVHTLVFFISFLFFQSLSKAPRNLTIKYENERDYFSTAGVVNCVLFAALIFLLFVSGAYKVWLGVMPKGQFRSTLGSLGAITYFLLYFIIPGSIALISIKFHYLEKKTYGAKILLITAYLMAFAFGASWGTKSTALLILIPGLSFLFWNIRLKDVIVFSLVALLAFVVFAVLFDGRSLLESIKQVFIRLTIVQGNMQWYIWEQYINGKLPDFVYTNFLWASLGDTFINNYFHYPVGSDKWIEMHYSNYITQMIGYKDGGVASGHNVQGGVFSEGVLWLGNMYFFLSLLSGALAGYFYGLVRKCYITRKYISASVLCTYFVFILIGWINSGGLAVLIHIAILTEFIVSFCFFKLLTHYKFYFNRTIYS